MKQKILVICSHPDDEILGCGGAIHRHISEGDIVKVIYTHEGSSSRFDINSNSQIIQKKIKSAINQREIMAHKVSKMLKFDIIKFYRNQNLVNKNFELLTLVKALLRDINNFKPQVIYTHHEFDLNEDHRYTFKATVNACRPNKTHMVKEIYSFETPSATEWADTFYRNKFRPNYDDATFSGGNSIRDAFNGVVSLRSWRPSWWWGDGIGREKFSPRNTKKQ